MNTSARVSVPPNGTIPEALKATGSDCRQEKLGNGFTITAVDAVVDPPPPVQVTMYVVLTVGETERDPEGPDGEKPVPLQEVALVDDHDSVDDAPAAAAPGLALKTTVGAVGDTAARTPCPTHPVRSSSKATCHHVYELLTGPAMTTPWFPCASEPTAGAPGVGVGVG
jgi:hypothetical protein